MFDPSVAAWVELLAYFESLNAGFQLSIESYWRIGNGGFLNTDEVKR